jgi:hypothetical protein
MKVAGSFKMSIKFTRLHSVTIPDDSNLHYTHTAVCHGSNDLELYCGTAHWEPTKISSISLVIVHFVTVREKIGPFATPEVIQHAPALPKTRSGKIMRRILRKVAQNDRDIGDISTLADEGIIEALFQNRIEIKA